MELNFSRNKRFGNKNMSHLYFGRKWDGKSLFHDQNNINFWV